MAQKLSLGGLEELLGFHLRMASAAVARDFMAATEGLDLTQRQFAVLELVAANPQASQIDLAGTLGTDRATMMALTDRLEARGLLARERSGRDRRRYELRLTRDGEKLMRTARRRIAAHEARFRERLGLAGAGRLTILLRRMQGG